MRPEIGGGKNENNAILRDAVHRQWHMMKSLWHSSRLLKRSKNIVAICRKTSLWRRYCRWQAKFLRANERLEAMVDVMRPDTRNPLGFEIEDDPDDTLPMFADVLDAAPGELPGLEGFFCSWTDQFANTHGARSESLYLTKSIAGLAVCAQVWGGSRPRAYLTWIERLLQCAERKTAVSATRDALDAIPENNGKLSGFRRRAARCLGKAGEQLGDPALILEGARCMFSIDPSNDTLMKLMHVSGKRKDETLAEATCLLYAWSDHRYLLAKALLIAGRIEETLEIARGCEPVGWSYGDNPGGLCFAAILALPVLYRLQEHHVRGDPESHRLQTRAKSCDTGHPATNLA